jgi:16S rRNA (cytosine1402-N4)-methyltransferase
MPTLDPYRHRSVLLSEVLDLLAPVPGGVYCDATLGGGGHAEAILERSSPTGRVLGLDRDPQALEAASRRLARFGDRFLPRHGLFGDLPAHLQALGLPPLHGIVADVGVSSPQLDLPDRGFSFQLKGPIDMRMDPSSGESALALIESLSTEELADILHTYGEEPRARPIARAIKAAAEAGALTDTLALAEVISRVNRTRPGGIHPATRTFQALRIAVNDELRQLDQLLHAAPACLRPGGRLVLISFHSLEDRIVKHRLRQLDGQALQVLTRKPISPSEAEIAENPRARSAHLRAAARSEVPPCQPCQP